MSREGFQPNICAIPISKSEVRKEETCLNMLMAGGISTATSVFQCCVPAWTPAALLHWLLPLQALWYRTFPPDTIPESGCLCLSPETKRLYSTALGENAAEGCQQKCKAGANLGSKPPHRFLLNLATKILSLDCIKAHLFHSQDTIITLHLIDSIPLPANSYVYSPNIQRKYLHTSFLRGCPKVIEYKISISLPFHQSENSLARFFPPHMRSMCLWSKDFDMSLRIQA